MADLLLLALLTAFFVGVGLGTPRRHRDGASRGTTSRRSTVQAGQAIWAATMHGIRTFAGLHDRRRAHAPAGWSAD